LGNIIVNLPKGAKEIQSDKTLKTELENANNLKLEITDLLHKCGADMAALAKQGAVQ
jgi:hypothetical protein